MSAYELAWNHYRASRLVEAEAGCRAILRKRRQDIEALNLLGIITARTGRVEESVRLFRQALRQEPRSAYIMVNLAESLRALGRRDEVMTLLLRAVTIEPGYQTAHYNLASELICCNELENALTRCQKGLTFSPSDPDLNGLAADLLIQLGRPSEAIPLLFTATTLAPQNDSHWRCLQRLLSATCLKLDERVREWMLQALRHPAVYTTEIVRSIGQSLCKDPMIARLLSLAHERALPGNEGLIDELERLGSDILLIELMESHFVSLPQLEHLFTELRRAILLGYEELEHLVNPSSRALRFCAALAVQAFLTDYAWLMTDEEKLSASALSERLGEPRQTDDPLFRPLMISVVGAYMPLYDSARVAQMALPSGLSNLIRIQIMEPLEEFALRTQIPTITPISDAVSLEVRNQYEENPFPRWSNSGTSEPLTFEQHMQLLGGIMPDDPTFSKPDVLIAGCGTGQHSIHAADRYASANILAIDLSLTSLAYAYRKTRNQHRSNITYAQGDLTQLSKLNLRFHVIECCGTLVCVDSPLDAWKGLVDLLHPHGIMFIGLYSEIARRAVVMARNEIAVRSLRPIAEDIRRFRSEILKLPDDHPLASLRKAKDFYNLSECRDLLFHVKEHRFTLPRIKSALTELNLHFLGFNVDTSAYVQRFPDDPIAISLENWHVFEQENPDTFFGMYQFWAQKV